ncbi:MAG: hypothetical protein ACYDAO_02760 [Thermoplasmataceae archaeon]
MLTLCPVCKGSDHYVLQVSVGLEVETRKCKNCNLIFDVKKNQEVKNIV